jgi:hypothetical protein
VQDRGSTLDRIVFLRFALCSEKLGHNPLSKGADCAALSTGARKNEMMAHVADID